MLRAICFSALLALLASSCGGSKCGDLCSDKMPCGPGLVCVGQQRCLMVSDAGPAACQ